MKTFANQSMVAFALWLALAPVLYGSSSQACQCLASGETKSARMKSPGETHCYVFQGKVGQGVVIEMADNLRSRTLHPFLQLYDPNGNLAAQDGDWVSWTSGTPSYSYVARIDSYRLTLTGPYTIVASGLYLSAGEYGLSLALAPGAATSAQDRDGGDMTLNQTRIGAIAPEADTDIYVFYGQVGQGIVIEMADSSGSPVLHPFVQLYDPNGNPVAQDGDWVSWTSGTPSYSFTARIDNYRLKLAGMYTIVASGLYASTGEYGLSVTVAPPKAPHGLYPYEPQPADGSSIRLCDSSPHLGDLVIVDQVLPGGGVVTRRRGGDLLGWWSVLGATGYDVYLAAGACMPLEKVAQNIVDPWVSMPELDPNEVYYWRVVAHTPSGDVGGPTWWFATEPCPIVVVYDFPLDSDPQWLCTGQWAFGVPSGQGGGPCHLYGSPDPAGGHTGQKVYGVNLDGDYDTKIGGPYWLVGGPFNLSGYQDVRLRFWRWLNTDWADYVKCSVEVSLDQKTWNLVWQNPQGTEVADAAWTLVEQDISAWADGQPSVYLRWSYQVVKERAYPLSGWNLDDIQLCGKRR